METLENTLQSSQQGTQETSSRSGMTAFTLKLIAIISMLIDHIGYVVVYAIADGRFPGINMDLEYTSQWNSVYWVMRAVGRLAFPIFCFFIVEGLRHTHSRPKYALRLALFALISEVPFDMAFHGTFWNIGYNNVLFTLLMGLLAIWSLDALKKKWESRKKALRWILNILISAGFAFLAKILNTDYGDVGVLAIVLMYLIGTDTPERAAVSMLGACLMLNYAYTYYELPALADVVLVYFYNGRPGPRMKYFFYLFYPVHLALLGLVQMLVIL